MSFQKISRKKKFVGKFDFITGGWVGKWPRRLGDHPGARKISTIPRAEWRQVANGQNLGRHLGCQGGYALVYRTEGWSRYDKEEDLESSILCLGSKRTTPPIHYEVRVGRWVERSWSSRVAWIAQGSREAWRSENSKNFTSRTETYPRNSTSCILWRQPGCLWRVCVPKTCVYRWHTRV